MPDSSAAPAFAAPMLSTTMRVAARVTPCRARATDSSSFALTCLSLVACRERASLFWFLSIPRPRVSGARGANDDSSVSTAELTGHARESDRPAHDVDLDADGPIERARARRRRGLASREVWPSAIVAAAFVAAAVACFALLPRSGGASVPVALALVAAYALAFRLEFEVGSGSAVPTQVLLVPILFALPLGLVPAAIGLAVVAGAAIDAAGGGAHLHRVPLRIANAWYVIGPVAVLAAAHERTPS